MITICCPVGGKTSWQELRYMLRSLETNLKAEFEITFMVNERLDWLNGEQVVITRGPSVDYETYTDTLKKYLAFAAPSNMRVVALECASRAALSNPEEINRILEVYYQWLTKE